MRRREFVTLLGGAAVAWPFAARAQQDGRMRRIGMLLGLAEGDPETNARLAGFRQGLARLGWSEGRNLHIEYRYARPGAPAQAFAKELVAQKPDLLVAHTTASATALQQESHTIPIVFIGIPDPVGSGYIASLARPGGKMTGQMLLEPSITGKWLAMLKEIAPRVARVALMRDPQTHADLYERLAKELVPSLSIEIVPVHIATAYDIERSIEALAHEPDGALLVPPDTTAVLHRDLIISLAARYRLPAVYQASFWVTAGGLMSYGTDRAAEWRQSAYYVDRILRGDKPADLPVQAPVKYETVLNLKTARAIGLTVSDLMLVRADEVIE